MTSLYHRLNLTRPPKKGKIPIWERINLERPIKPRCLVCKNLVQDNWKICPHCGAIQKKLAAGAQHCIWIDSSGISPSEINIDVISELLADSFSKVFSAFRSIQVFLTSEPPVQEWGDNFTHVYILFSEVDPVDYLGIASFRFGMVTKQSLVRLDQILQASYRVNLSTNQLSNLIANTIVHEIGHTLGLDHSELRTDVMHDGLDHRIHSLMPPSFHAEQITRMNHAINLHKAPPKK
jgi:hypothetical protein